MQVAISAGEASGDRAGSQLASELRALCPEASLWGIGGSCMRAAGVDLLFDSTRFSAIGVAAGLALLPRLLRERRKVYAEILRRRPDVLVAIDAGAFHLGFGPWEGLCPFVRRNLPDTQILVYFPPGSWRRQLRGTTLNRAAHRVATPFPWSETELKRLGVDATFVGHPMLDLAKPSAPPSELVNRYGIDDNHPVIGLLPGSRRQEIREILPVLFDAAAQIHCRVPGVQFVVALAPGVRRETIEAAREEARHRWRARQRSQPKDKRPGDSLGPRTVVVPVEGRTSDLARKNRAWFERSGDLPGDGDFPLLVVEDATYDVMAVSDLLLTASGTATLEAAIMGKPMVIVYRLAHELEYRLVRSRIPAHIGMPNLLADRRICPELLQADANPEAIASEAIGLLLEPERMIRMRADLKAATASLGEPGGARRTAQMVLEMGNRA